MVEIEYMPTKKIVVHEMYKHSTIEDLIKRIVSPEGARPLFWCDGILFTFYLDDGDEARKEYIKGTMHWDMLAYTEMQSFRDSVELDEGMFKGVKVPVLNYSGFVLFKDLTKWIKSKKA